MRSKPGDFFCGHLSITNLTSLEEKCFTGREIGRGEFRDSATAKLFSRENISGWGWNVS
jgi:hypothetical protein